MKGTQYIYSIITLYIVDTSSLWVLVFLVCNLESKYNH